MIERRTAAAVVLASLVGCAQIVGIERLDVAPGVADAGPHASSAPPALVDASHDAPAAVVPRDSGNGDADGVPVKHVFVTDDTLPADFGGLSGADAHCAVRASLAGRGDRTWTAWLSDASVNAIDRITWDGPYFRYDGKRVVLSKSQLALGALESPISVTENGTAAASEVTVAVWTGTTREGERTGQRCGDWSTTDGTALGTVGSLEEIDSQWTIVPRAQPFPDGNPCNHVGRIYCFEQ